MKRRWVLVILLLTLSALLAYFLRDVINERIVIPFAYIWWRIGLFYHSVEEDTWLLLTVIVITLIAYGSITADIQFMDENSQDIELAQGSVEGLAVALEKSSRRPYYRWLVANQISRLARLFLAHEIGHKIQNWDGTSEAPGWDPPEDLKTYFRYGLHRPSTDSNVKPFDPEQAVEFLESKIGDHYDAN